MMGNRQERRNRRERHLFVTDQGAVQITAEGHGVSIEGEQLDKVLAGNQIDDVPEGQHVWAMFAMFRCPHPELASQQPAMMDAESLILVTGPGCYRCEVHYTKGAELTRCPGSPG
jgi:hypothetical protein